MMAIGQPVRRLILLALWGLWIPALSAQPIQAGPADYLGTLNSLQPGDTLLLAPGTYSDRLKLTDVQGTAQNPIVIMGDETNTVFTGNACCNTVSLTRCAWLVLRDFTIDGQNIPNIDGVKAEGTTDNWAHHITLDNLRIIGHGANQNTVGISTKCPAWDWAIRWCTIDAAGTGLYLGNSDGEDPFVNGIIEHNLVVNTVGYNLQIKHQNVGSRNIPGMTLDGRTIIRHNVLSKAENASSGGNARPNLLVGNFPASGDGSEDVYEIYGNVFWQNPVENLFQGTGRLALYDNIGINTAGGGGFSIQSQNGFAPQTCRVFHNTLYTSSNWGLRLMDTDPAYTKTVAGNAVFSDHATPIRLVGGGVASVDLLGNITDVTGNAGDYVADPTIIPGILDLYPIPGSPLQAAPLDSTAFLDDPEFDRDFNGTLREWSWRGAYSGSGSNPGWTVNLDRKPIGDPLTSVFPTAEVPEGFRIFPNPSDGYFRLEIKGISLPASIDLIDPEGRVRLTREWTVGDAVDLDVRTLPRGVYVVRVNDRTRTLARRVLIH